MEGSPQSTSLARYDAARLALQEAHRVDEVKDIRDKAEAMAAYARQAKDTAMVEWATEIKVRAERRAGQILSDMPKALGGRPAENRSYDATSFSSKTLSDIGVTKDQSSRWQKLAAVSDIQFEQAVAAAKEVAGEVTTAAMLRMADKRDSLHRKQEEYLDRTRQVTPPLITQADALEWLGSAPACDLLLTDPPYQTDVEDIGVFSRSWLPMALGLVKPTGRAYVCIGAYPDELRAYLDISPPAHLRLEQVLVLTYRNTIGPSPKNLYKQNWQAILYYVGVYAPPLDCLELNELFSVQDISAPDGRHGTRLHAWQKPDELGDRFIRHSTKPGQTVLDPFACTGTFLLAASKYGCIALGCDIDQDNLAIAESRGCNVVSY